MFNVLMVCTANVCRSPASQVLLARSLAQKKVQVDSAGVLAVDGNRADPFMAALLETNGYPEISLHRSRALMPSYLRKYQLILCMESDHINRLRRADPTATGRVMLLGHWLDSQEIADPTGRSAGEYEYAYSQMMESCSKWAQKLVQIGMIE